MFDDEIFDHLRLLRSDEVQVLIVVEFGAHTPFKELFDCYRRVVY